MAVKTPCTGCITWFALLSVFVPLTVGIAAIVENQHTEHHKGLVHDIERNEDSIKQALTDINHKLGSIQATSSYNSGVLAEVQRMQEADKSGH